MSEFGGGLKLKRSCRDKLHDEERRGQRGVEKSTAKWMLYIQIEYKHKDVTASAIIASHAGFVYFNTIILNR